MNINGSVMTQENSPQQQTTCTIMKCTTIIMIALFLRELRDQLNNNNDIDVVVLPLSLCCCVQCTMSGLCMISLCSENTQLFPFFPQGESCCPATVPNATLFALDYTFSLCYHSHSFRNPYFIKSIEQHISYSNSILVKLNQYLLALFGQFYWYFLIPIFFRKSDNRRYSTNQLSIKTL